MRVILGGSVSPWGVGNIAGSFLGAMRSHTKILLCPPAAADPSDCGMLIYHNVSLTLSYLSGTWAEPSRPTDGRCLRPL